MKTYYMELREKGTSDMQYSEGGVIGLVTSCVGIAV